MTLRSRSETTRDGVARRSAIARVAPDLIATATLVIDTRGAGFTEFTGEAACFVSEAGAGNGALLLFCAIPRRR